MAFIEDLADELARDTHRRRWTRLGDDRLSRGRRQACWAPRRPRFEEAYPDRDPRCASPNAAARKFLVERPSRSLPPGPAGEGVTDRLDRADRLSQRGRPAEEVLRATPLADGSRRENSAEHSWHLALYAWCWPIRPARG